VSHPPHGLTTVSHPPYDRIEVVEQIVRHCTDLDATGQHRSSP
jgi:hypothetical protein